jgi:hypothetical protein
LMLVGRLGVARRTTFAGAARALGTRDLWEAKHHVLAVDGEAEEMRKVPLQALAHQLRFLSRQTSRLKISKGRVNPQQFQAMRVLSGDSAKLLEQFWYGRAPVESLRFKPTADPVKFDALVTALQRLNLARPPGTRRPERVPSSAHDAFLRSPVVKAWVLQAAKGSCECCKAQAPFKTVLGVLFLEVHHVTPLADGGSDTPENTVAVCPNCHRALHLAADRDNIIAQLFKKVKRLSPER